MDTPPSPRVSLPSIHEMFPEHLMTKKTDRPQPKRQISPSSPASSSSSSRFGAILPSHHAAAHRDPACSRPRAPAEVVSFDVLRSDPASSSLQHLGSSDTLPSRGASIGFHPNQAGVDRGTAPAFRVAVNPGSTPPPADASCSSSRPHAYQPPPADATSVYVKDAPSTSASATSMHPSIISFAVAGSPPANADVEADDPANASEGDDGPNDGPASGKKHVCPTCYKRFNRPSSLRIHVNTHTGATPFRCPWPNCGREFNVNSNMRRHYRNHTTPGFSRQPNDNRSRRRRIESVDVPGDLRSTGVPTLRRVAPDGFVQPPHPVYSDDSDGYESDYGRKDYEDEYTYPPPPRSWGGPHILTQSMARVSVGSSPSSSIPAPQQQHHEAIYSQHHRHSNQAQQRPYPHGLHPPPPPPSASHHRPQYHPQYHHHQVSPRHHPYPLPQGRTYTSGEANFHSSESASPSPSPPPPPQPRYQLSAVASQKETMYNPSAPYSHSMADSRVSTTLRPAFHPAARVSSERHSYATRAPSGNW